MSVREIKFYLTEATTIIKKKSVFTHLHLLVYNVVKSKLKGSVYTNSVVNLTRLFLWLHKVIL